MRHNKALLLTLFLLFGCGLKKLAVSNADLILVYQIEKRMPLSGSQKKELPQQIDHFLNQNKQIAKDLIVILKDIDLNPIKTDHQYDEINLLYQKLASSFFVILSKHLSHFDDKQQLEQLKIFKIEDEKLSNVTSEERLNKITDRMEYLFGDIKKDQRQLLTEALNEWELRHQEHLEKKKKLQVKILDLMAQMPPTGEKQQSLQQTLNDYVTSYSASNQNKQMIKRISYSLHPEQKDHFKKRIKELIEMLTLFVETDY